MNFPEKLFAATQALGDVLVSRQNRDRKSVTLEELKVGVWRNSDNSSIRVESLDPLKISISSKQIPEYQSLLLADQEALRVMLEGEGYSFETEVATKEPGVVVDIDAARVLKGVEVKSHESDEVAVRAQEHKSLFQGNVETFQDITNVLGKVASIVSTMKSNNRTSRYSEQVRRLIDSATDINAANLDATVKNGIDHQLTAEDIARERERLTGLQDILKQSHELFDRVDPSKKIGTAEQEGSDQGASQETSSEPIVEGTGNAVRGKSLEALLRAKTHAPRVTGEDVVSPVEEDTVPPVVDAAEGNSKKKKTPAILQGEKKPEADTKAEPTEGSGEGGPGGPEGPKGPEEFGTVLGELRTEVATIIKEIKTPQDFGALREPMVLKESKESGREPRRYFFHLKSIRERLGNRELEEGEMALVTNLEKELRQLADQKFDEVLVADFKEQHRHGRAVLNEAKDETTLTALADTWAKESPIVNSWEAVSQYLTEEERTLVREGRERQSAVLMRALEKKLARFHDGQEFKKFVGHPEGRVLAERFREALSGEWRKFQGALKYHKLRLSEDAALAEWNEHYLPVIRQAILTRLMKQSDVTQDQAEAILRTIMNDLDHQERAKSIKKQ